MAVDLRVVTHNPWVQAGLWLLGFALVGLVCWLLSPVLIPLFFAFLVAYSFDPVIDFFERLRISRIVAILILMFTITLVLLLTPLYLVPSIIEQSQNLVTTSQTVRTPDMVDIALNYLPVEYWMKELGWVPQDWQGDARAVITARLGEMVQENAREFITVHARDFVGIGQRATANAAQLFSEVANKIIGFGVVLGNLVLFVFVAIYLLKDYDRIVAEAGALIPLRYREYAFEVFRKIDFNLRGWLRGQATVCLFLGVSYGLGFWLSGVPFWFILATIGGIVSFVPFLGIAITIGPAVLLTLLAHGLGGNVLGVLATFAIAQFMEGNIITPRIMGSTVGLAPVWVILAIMVFGSTLGFAGLLLAVPIAAVLKVLVGELVNYYRRSELYKGRSEAEKSADMVL